MHYRITLAADSSSVRQSAEWDVCISDVVYQLIMMMKRGVKQYLTPFSYFTGTKIYFAQNQITVSSHVERRHSLSLECWLTPTKALNIKTWSTGSDI